MTRIRIIVTLSALAALATACLESPLLNHAEARDPAATEKEAQADAPPQPPAAASDELTAKCPLAFARAKLCASLTWDRMPSDDETGKLVVRFWNKDGATESGPYVDPADTVAIKLWMPSMGHGSSPVKVARALDASGAAIPGVYFGSDVYFSMPGKWEIWVQLKRGRDVVEQAKVEIEI